MHRTSKIIITGHCATRMRQRGPLSKTWVPAQLMRDQTKEAQQRVGKKLTSTDDGL